MIKKMLLGTLCFLFAFCKQKPVSEETNQFEVTDQVISLTENSNIKDRIKTSKANEEEYSFNLVASGLVRTIPNKFAEIAPPFAGRIQKSFVRLGQKVQVGSPIFEISSPDYFEAQKEYFDAKQEYKQAQLNLKRQKDLLDNGVGVQQELEEAETDYQAAKAAFTNAGSALKIYSVNPDQVVLGSSLIVRAPIAGEVLSNDIVLGQYIKDDAEPVAIIASLDKVRVAGQVKEKDLHHLENLDQANIVLSAYPNNPIVGKIIHINDIIDEETRSVEVLIEVDNADRKLKPGMYVNVNFINKPKQEVFIPTKSVMQGEDSAFVFVKVGDNKFKRKDIVTSRSVGDKTIVTEGLAVGEEIVSEGGIYLLQAN